MVVEEHPGMVGKADRVGRVDKAGKVAVEENLGMVDKEDRVDRVDKVGKVAVEENPGMVGKVFVGAVIVDTDCHLLVRSVV